MLVKNTDFNEQLVISHCLLCVASTCDAARFCVIRFSAEQSPSLSSVSSVKKKQSSHYLSLRMSATLITNHQAAYAERGKKHQNRTWSTIVLIPSHCLVSTRRQL